MPRRARRGNVEHGEGEPRLEHLVRQLRGVEGRLERERRRARVAVAPRESLAGLLRPPLGLEGLRPGDDREVEVAGEDRGGGVLHEHLGGGAADARVEAVPGVDGERVGETVDGTVVRPGHAVDDLQAVRRREHPTGPGCGAGVGGGRAGDLVPQRQRLGRRALARSDRPLGDADHARRAGIDRHRRLATLPDGLALLGERLRPLLGVLAREHPDRHLVLDAERLLEGAGGQAS